MMRTFEATDENVKEMISETLEKMPKYDKFMKDMVTKKRSVSF